jgi:hypothetical protein
MRALVETGFGRPLRKRPFVAMVAVIVVAALVPAIAFAQRGGDFVGSEVPDETPRKGFPGLFNTHMAEKDGVVVSAPLPQVDYGLSEHLTVGFNVHPSLSVGEGYPPGAIGRLRYRLHSAGKVASVATLMVGGGRGGGSTYVGALASKALSIDVAPNQRMSLSAFGVSLRRTERADQQYAAALGFAIDHDIFFNDRFGVNATMMLVPLVRAREHGPREELSRYGVGLDEQTFVRALGVIKPHPEWLLQLGGAASINFDNAIPWLEVAKRW